MRIRILLAGLMVAGAATIAAPNFAAAQHGDEHAAPAHGEGHGEAAEGHGDGHDAHGSFDNGFTFSELTHMESFGELKGAFINFILLMAIFIYVIRNKVNPGLAEGRKQMEEALAEAARIKQAAEEKQAEYADRLAKLDDEVEDIRAEMVKAGEAERDRIVAEAERKSARLRKDTEFVISQRMKQLREDLTQEAVTAAVTAAEAVLRDKTTPADQTRLADDYLAQLGELASQQESRA